MLVGEGGRILGSVTIGGCVDAQVIEEAASVIARTRPGSSSSTWATRRRGRSGSPAAGPSRSSWSRWTWRSPTTPRWLYERLQKHGEAGGRGALLTRLDAPDNKSRPDGAPRSSCSTRGSARAPWARPRSTSGGRGGAGAIQAGKSATLTVEGVRVFAEVFAPPSILLIVGAGHVAMPMVHARPRARLQDHRHGRPAALRHARALSRRRRPQDRHSLRAGPDRAAGRLDGAGPRGPRLQVRSARAPPRAGHARWATSGSWARAGGARPSSTSSGKTVSARTRSTGCTCPSVSISAPSRRRRSPWPSWPRSSPSSAAPRACRSARRSDGA